MLISLHEDVRRVLSDPPRFSRTQAPIPDRTAGHVAFDHGVHHCLGAPPARVETWIAIALLRRFADPAPRPMYERTSDQSDKETEMHTKTTDSPQHATGRRPVTAAHTEGNRIRLVAFWFTTIVIVFELIAGSAWNLLTIDWIEAQMDHLGYPDYFAYILGVCHFGAAVTIVVPGFRMIKEWAYAGIFFTWSGAVVSHLAQGDGLVSWGPPLMFLAFAVASWALRPADRRLQETRLRRDRSADAGRDSTGRPETRPRAWAVSIGIVVVLSAVSLLTLPAAEDLTGEWAVERGWVGGQRP
ncbi:DoxX family protein [Streptomyces sp. OZ13]|uniref:DoxX family protein n=1 Tax=Streptomyces sp. OZ13 TaxID=3452210 RepID=UPI003F8BA678